MPCQKLHVWSNVVASLYLVMKLRYRMVLALACDRREISQCDEVVCNSFQAHLQFCLYGLQARV